VVPDAAVLTFASDRHDAGRHQIGGGPAMQGISGIEEKPILTANESVRILPGARLLETSTVRASSSRVPMAAGIPDLSGSLGVVCAYVMEGSGWAIGLPASCASQGSQGDGSNWRILVCSRVESERIGCRVMIGAAKAGENRARGRVGVAEAAAGDLITVAY